jgi:hypothetical protein
MASKLPIAGLSNEITFNDCQTNGQVW